jgi:hypothetical protein
MHTEQHDGLAGLAREGRRADFLAALLLDGDLHLGVVDLVEPLDDDRGGCPRPGGGGLGGYRLTLDAFCK